MSTLGLDYSGVVVNQNQRTATLTGAPVNQEFRLPGDFLRGTLVPQAPLLTGFQLLATVTDAQIASVTYQLQHYDVGIGWETLAEGTEVGCQAVGSKVWFEVYFSEPVVIPVGEASDRFQLILTPNSAVTALWYASPNPLATDNAYVSGTIVPGLGVNVASLAFRIMAGVADEGTDFLGNRYRGFVTAAGPDNVSRVADALWLSKPNPSRFAVENLYFDLTKDADGQVIDRITLDPITPNVYFNVYYSNDGGSVTDEADWENKLWTRVPFTYQAKRRETFALPAPIKARFVCLEFTHLQAKYYAPGNFQKPTAYKKHPKWVLDYFLLRQNILSEDPFLSSVMTVKFNSLDLAYNYYLDDLHQEPDTPAEVNDPRLVTNFLTNRNDVSDKVDSTTLLAIRTTFDQYQTHPAYFAKLDYLPALYAINVAATGPPAGPIDYPRELPPPPSSVTTDVSAGDRNAVLLDQGMPVMFFYVTCRHAYRQLTATLSHDRAYFAGIKEVSFSRDKYSIEADTEQYIESTGDTTNLDRNDFANIDFVWQTYDSAD